MSRSEGRSRAATVTVLVIGALAAAAPVHAQWTIGAFLGNAWNLGGDLRLDAADGTGVMVHDVEYHDKSLQFPLYYGVRIARHVRKDGRLGIEAEFLHLKAISRPEQLVRIDGQVSGADIAGMRPLGDVLPRFELSHGLNFLFVNVVARVPVRTTAASRFAVTARGGVGPTIPHVEGRFLGRDENAYQWGGLGWQAAGGVEFRLAPWLLATSEVKWTATRQRVTVAGSSVEGLFRAAHVVGGVSWVIAEARSPSLISAPLWTAPSGGPPAGLNAASEPSMPSVASLVLNLPGDIRRAASLSSAVIMGVTGATSLAVRPHDSDIAEHLSSRLGDDAIFYAGGVVGELAVQAGAAATVYGVGRLVEHAGTAALGADLLRSHILNAGVTHGTKALVRRRRPDGARGSFPSGHASASFATAAVLQRHLGWKVGVPAYALAAYTGASRVAANSHYLSDVLVGAAIGSTLGRAVAFRRRGTRFVLTPAAGAGTAGILLTGSL